MYHGLRVILVIDNTVTGPRPPATQINSSINYNSFTPPKLFPRVGDKGEKETGSEVECSLLRQGLTGMAELKPCRLSRAIHERAERAGPEEKRSLHRITMKGLLLRIPPACSSSSFFEIFAKLR